MSNPWTAWANDTPYQRWNRYRYMRFLALRQAHETELGVRWSAQYRGAYGRLPERLYFGSFGRRGAHYWPDCPDPAPKGNGRIALREFCELCDRFGLHSELFTNYRALDDYYKAFGFLLYGRGPYRLREHSEARYFRFAQSAEERVAA
jgi:hypothetical protein